MSPVILVTRPWEEGQKFVGELRAAGMDALHAPLFTLTPVPVKPDHLPENVMLIFTSAAAVRFMPDTINQAKAICVGDVTAAAARMAGFDVMAIPGGSAHDILNYCLQHYTPESAPYFYHIRGNDAALALDEAFINAGFKAGRLIVYRADPALSLVPDALEAIRHKAVDAVTIFSARTADEFMKLMQQENLQDCLSNKPFFCISNAVAQSVRLRGAHNVIVAARPTGESMIEALRDYYRL